MTRYVVGRVLELPPLLLGLSFILFLILALAPGDPIDVMLSNGPQTSAVDIQALKHAYGLDQPIPVRYVKWLGRVAQGDLGWSIQDHSPVATLIGKRFPNSAMLMGAGLLLSVAVAIPIGTYSALHRYSAFDYAGSLFSFVGFSTPIFWAGLILIYFFSIKWRLLPAGGFETAGGLNGLAGAADRLRHMILPVTVLALYNMASLARYTRSSMLEVLHEDYIRTARSKGMSERRVIRAHALRNALVPVVTVLALILPALFGGAPVTETVFSWPGLGQLLINAVLSGDLPVAQGVLLILSVGVLVANLFADLAYAALDPRIRYG